MLKHIRYAGSIAKAFTKATQKFIQGEEPVEVFKDMTGDLFEARYNLWPKKVQAEVMNSAHFSGKMLMLIEKVRKLLASEDLQSFLEGMEAASRKKMVDDITFATEMETVGPRQAAISMVARRLGQTWYRSSTSQTFTKIAEKTSTEVADIFLAALEKARTERLERLRQADAEIPDGEIQINDEEDGRNN
jgi:hypothetical protein